MSTIAQLLVGLGIDTKEYSSGLDSAEKQARGFGSVIQNAAGTALGFMGAQVGLKAIGGAFSLIKESAFGMNATLEKSTLQFTTLMGNSKDAETHVKDLFAFAAKTPFETGPIIEASRIMRTFGGASLDTKENLTLFGDAAAATSQPINDIAFWMSRAYAAIKGGQPFGEARMRLMEMGVITPDIANKLDKLAASGASSDKVWAELTGSLGKFNGAMLLQANTWEGLTSSISDNVHILLATAFKPLFDLTKAGFSTLLDFLGQLQASGAIDAFGQKLASIISGFFTFAGTLITTVTPAFQFLVGLFNDLTGEGGGIGVIIDDINELVGIDIAPAVVAIQSYIQVWIDLGTTIFNVVKAILGGDLQGAWTALTTGFGTVVSDYETYAQNLYTLLSGVASWLAANLPLWGQQFVAWIQPYIPQALALLDRLVAQIEGWVLANAPILYNKLLEWGKALINWIQPYIPPLLAQLGVLIGQVWAWIVAQIPGIVEKLKTWGQALLTWIQPYIPVVLAALGVLANNLWAWVVAQAAVLLAKFSAWATALGAWIPDAVVNFLAQWPGMLNKFLDWIGNAAGPLLAKLGEWGLAFIKWIAPQIPGILVALAGVAAAILVFIGETVITITAKLLLWAAAMVNWVNDNVIPALPGVLASIVVAFANWITSTKQWLNDQSLKLGQAIVSGIKSGISSMWGSFLAWVHDQIMKIPAAVRQVLGISSPSQVFADEVGYPIVLGILDGMENGIGILVSGIEAIIHGANKKAAAAAQQMLDNIAAVVNSAAVYAREIYNSFVNLREIEIVPQFNYQPLIDATKALEDRTKSLNKAQDASVAIGAKMADNQIRIEQLQAQIAHDPWADHTKQQAELNDLTMQQNTLLQQQMIARKGIADAQKSVDDAAADQLNAQRAANQLAEQQRQGIMAVAQEAQKAYQALEGQVDQLMETDPKSAAELFRQRSAQIKELADLEKQRVLSTDTAEQQALDTQIRLLKAAQAAETTAGNVQISIASQTQQISMAEIIGIITDALRQAGINVDIRQRTT